MSRIRELNVIKKKGRPGDLRIALLYPSFYRVALDTLSYHMLYYYINGRRGFIAERFNISRKTGREPPPLSIENRNPLKNFDVIIASVHYEPDYVNILRVLYAGGVPAFSSEREKPYVIVGGPAVIGNPEPLAEIADVLALGDIEPIMPYLLDQLLEHYDSKKMLLDSLPPEKGFYVPRREDELVLVNKAESLTLKFHPIAQIQPAERDPRGRKTMIEAMRGCIRGCRFCLEGSIFKPKRERSFDQIRYIAEEGSRLNKSRKIVLLALSYFDHSESDRVLEYLVENGFEFSVPSIRVETLSEDRIELMVAGGQKTLTIAPETADSWLGAKIGKPFAKSLVENIASLAKRIGVKSLKLYFMVGLPGETLEHVKKIAYFVKELSEKSGFKGVRELKVSISPFTPKPHTPMQWFRVEDIATLKKKINFLKRELGGLAEVRSYDPRWTHVQTVLTRGDRKIGKVIALWAKYGGGLGAWRKALKDLGVNPQEYLTPPHPHSKTPWEKVVLTKLF